MATTPVSPTALVKDTSQTTNRTPKSELGKDEFLQILASQLANQDPMSPMSDTDFIAQMAQFSSLEQMQQMNTSMTSMTGAMSSQQMYGLIGKDIIANVTDGKTGETTPILGRVTGVARENGEDFLTVGEYMIPMSAVLEVVDSGTQEQSLMAQSSNLIGKTVEGTVITTDDKGNNKTETVSGVVEYIMEKNGTLYAKLKDSGKEVMIAGITKVYTTDPNSGATTPAAEEG